MKAMHAKLLSVLIVAAVLVCLPVAGMAEYADFSAETLAGIGIPRGIAPMLNETAYQMFYLDYDNDGEITVDELNQNVTMTVKAGEGISINEVTGFTSWTDSTDGQEYIDYPAFVYEVTGKQAEGEMIVARMTNTLGATYEHKLTVALKDLVRKSVKVETSPAGKLVENSYGNYDLTVSEGTTITFAPEYETLNGEKADLSYEWWIYSYETGDYTTAKPVSTDSVLTATEPLNNCDYLCMVVSKDDSSLTDQVWIYVTVTPDADPVHELIEYDSAAKVGVIRGIGPFMTEAANALICDYDDDGEITVDELNANIGCSMTVGSNITIIEKVLTFSIYEEDGEVWIDWPYFAYRADNMSADGEKITFVITTTRGDRVEIRWTLDVSPADQVMVDTDYQEGLSQAVVSEPLKQIEGLNTAEKITAEMTIKVMAEASAAGMEVSADNVKVYDVYLTVSTDGGTTWVKADEDNWPASGKVTARLPYPEGTNKNYHFVIAHMFTTDAFGKTPGDIEYPVVRKYDTYLEFDVTGLSPVSIAWSEPAPAATVPSTGDNATPYLWLLGMAMAAVGYIVLNKRRQHN